MKIDLPRHLWYGNTDLPIDFSDDWDVQICPMKGVDAPALSHEQLKQEILTPIDSPTLNDLAEGKQSAVIIFDDMTRPTRTYEIAPIVLEALLAAGIPEEKITFVCALGTHGALTQHEFRKKLGSDITRRFRVYNHNIYENCVEVGITKRGSRSRPEGWNRYRHTSSPGWIQRGWKTDPAGDCPCRQHCALSSRR